MRRLRRTFALLLLAGLCLAQTASMMTNPDVRRVGLKLACLCSRCKNSVGDCQMLGCSYAGGARERIAQMQAAGASDEEIVAKFVEKEGIRALAVPPASGFNLTAWLMPVAAILIGLYAIYAYVRFYRRPAAVPQPNVAAKYADLAEKDLAKLE
jgi:cytochrome c-type biogenesis protein CcmH/NrfF